MLILILAVYFYELNFFQLRSMVGNSMKQYNLPRSMQRGVPIWGLRQFFWKVNFGPNMQSVTQRKRLNDFGQIAKFTLFVPSM